MKKGRNSSLIQRRNAQIALRYYYWTEERRLRFDDAIRQLSENEFFLSESRIIHILKHEASDVPAMKLKVPKVPNLTEEQVQFFKSKATTKNTKL